MLARLEALLRSSRLRAVGAVVCVAIFVVLAVQLVRLGRSGALDLTEVDWPLVIGAMAVHAIALTALGAVWPCTVRALGGTPPRGLLPVFYVGQLAKYVPGGAWQYLGRAGLAVRLGLPLRIAGGSLGVETACLLVALMPLAPLVLATDRTGALLAGALCLLLLAGTGLGLGRVPLARCWLRGVLTRVAGGEVEVRPAAVRAATGRYLATWVAFGFGFWLIGAGFVGATVAELPFYIGVFAISWGVSFVVVVAPGGLGVREAVIVALLGPRIGAADALLVATASRAAFMLADLGGGSIALWLLRGVRRADETQSAHLGVRAGMPPSSSGS